MSSETKGLTNDGPASSPGDDRLASWKEIAAYLKCSERTVRRWESEGLPVHRHSHKKKAGVYAYKSEIEAWWDRDRHGLKTQRETEGFAGEPTQEAAEEIPVDPARKPWLLFSGMALVCLLLAFGLFKDDRIRRRLFGKVPAGHIHALAVLPLQNLWHDPDQDYFAQGMTEELITDLAQIGSLRVISSTSSMQYKGTKKPLPEIARELSVDAIVEGTVQRSGDHVHITAQLVDATNDQHIWAKAYDRDLRDILTLENEVARSIADEIEIQLTPEQRARLTASAPVDREAYELYLKGRYFWSKRNPPELRKALERFQQAADKQPDFAPAFSGLADTYSLLGAAGFDVLPRAEAMERARAAASRALELDSKSAEAHASMAYVLYSCDWNWLAAEKEFRRAIALKPNYATAHEWYSEYLNDLGRKEEALAEAQTALELDPISPLANQFVARAHYFAHRFDQAIEYSQKTIEIDPNFSTAHLRLGRAYAAKGMYSMAIKEFEEFGRLSGDGSLALASIGNAKGQARDRASAMRALHELTKLSKQKKVTAICFALVHIGLGNNDQAMAWLDTAYKERSDFLLVLKVDPLFDALRSDPRFQKLLLRLNFPS